MKEQMTKIMDAFHKYNVENMAEYVFGFDRNIVYDALVVAPAYTPYKLGLNKFGEVYTLYEGAYIGGYLLIINDLKIAWVKTAASDTNLIDHMAICAELNFNKMIFVGAVGALKGEFELGDICTPQYSIAGGAAHFYLKESIKEYIPFEKVYPNDTNFIKKIAYIESEKGFEIKTATVFCTPSVSLEYLHLNEIKEFDTDLIEMETAAFYLMADLIEVPSIALLVVSDNSASGVALVGRNEEQQKKYDESRKVILPNMIIDIASLREEEF